MKSRVELMHETVAATRDPGHPVHGPLMGAITAPHAAPVEVQLPWAVSAFETAYQSVDDRFVFHVDYDGPVVCRVEPNVGGELPSALILSNGQAGQRLPLTWTSHSVSFDRGQQGCPTLVVPLGAGDGYERLVEAIEKVATNFFDRNQPR